MKTRRERKLEAQVADLQTELDDAKVELNAMTETAGDWFTVALAAAEHIESDHVLMEAAHEMILDLQEKVEDLENDAKWRQEEEEAEQREHADLKRLHEQPAMANWVMLVTNTLVDGLLLSTEPDKYGRKRQSVTEIDHYGNDGQTTTTTTGKATVTFNLPLFGHQTAYANIEHVEISDTPTSKKITVRNTVIFNFDVGGENREIKVVSGGRVMRGCGEWYSGEVFTQVLVGPDSYYSIWSEKYRGSGAKNAEVSTEPMATEPRRYGGCGG